MVNQSSFKGFINNVNHLFLEQLNKENQLELKELIKRADLFVDGKYVFQNDWDMEKTNKIEILNLKEMDWNYNPEGDPEWTYMLNRHAFLLDVAVSYRITNNKKYLNYLKKILLLFVKDCPLTVENKKTSWRTIDSGLRVVNWVRVFEVVSLNELFEESEQNLIIKSLEEHLNYLSKELSIERGQSNWLVIEICGLILGEFFLGINNYLETSLDFLKIALELQIEEDGLQREQSFMYHHEVLLCVLMIIHILKRNKQSIPPWLKTYAEKMTNASVGIMTGHGKQVAFGDSDIESMIGILEVAEIVLSRPFLPMNLKKSKTTLFTKLFVGLNNEIFSKRLSRLVSKNYKNSGISILRNNKNSDFTLFKCGGLGGGHGHDDLLHVALEFDNESILVDSGRYSYEVTHNRLLFKEAKAHNTITINRQNFNQHEDAWGTSKVSTPINQKFSSIENIHFAEGGHLGYFNEGTFVNRKVIYIEDGIWLISDEIFTNKEMIVDSHFHFATDNLKKNESGYSYSLSNGETIEITASLGDGKFIKEDCLISPEYNSYYSSKKLRYERKINQTNIQTFIFKSNKIKKQIKNIPVFSSGEEMSKEIVEGFVLIDEKGNKEYLIIQHQEPNEGRRAYQIDGQYVYGKIVYTKLDKIGSSLKRIVLD